MQFSDEAILEKLLNYPEFSLKHEDKFRIAFLADPQYANLENDLEERCYFRATPKKMTKVMHFLNQQSLDLVVTLGDIVDRAWQDYPAVLKPYEDLCHPHLFVLGNHDAKAMFSQFQVDPNYHVPIRYHSWSLGHFRFIMIDGNDRSLHAYHSNAQEYLDAKLQLSHLAQEKKQYAKSWNGALSPSQFEWLEEQLIEAQQAQQQVVVVGHYALDPNLNAHNLWNCEEITALLHKYGAKVSLNGHNHCGAQYVLGETLFYTVPGIVADPYIAPLIILEISKVGELSIERHYLIKK